MLLECFVNSCFLTNGANISQSGRREYTGQAAWIGCSFPTFSMDRSEDARAEERQWDFLGWVFFVVYLHLRKNIL